MKLFLSDLEIACDEKVLSRLHPSEIGFYAHCLLDEVKSTNVFVSAFGGAKIRTRIGSILSYKKLTFLSLSASLLLIVSVMYVLLTNAA